MRKVLYAPGLLFVATFAPTAGFTATATPAQPCTVIAATNDLHGAIEPTVRRVGPRALRVGGLYGLSAYVQALKRRYGERMVLLDGGDLYQGTLASNLSRGRAIIEAYNILGYDAVAVGNHEFDFGPAQPPRGDQGDLLGVIKRRISEARFPFLAVNIREAASGEPPRWPNLQPTALLKAGSMTIGVVGAASQHTAQLTRPTYVASLRFDDPVPHVVRHAARLRQAGAHLIVLLGHMGTQCSDPDPRRGDATCDADGELVRVLRALPPGTVDVAVGGHTHKSVAHFIASVPTIEAGSRGGHIAWVEACLLPEGGLDRTRTRIQSPIEICLDAWPDGGCHDRPSPPIPQQARFLGKPVAPDSLLVQRMAPYLRAVTAQAARPVGVTLHEPLRVSDDGKGLGWWVAESLRHAASAQVAIQNRGGVRADLDAGPLNYGEVYRALPFDNLVVRITLRGEQLLRLVTRMTARRGVPPYVAGMTVQSSTTGALLLRDDTGAAIAPERHYTLATNDYLLQGGEGLDAIFHAVPENHKRATGVVMRDALIDLLRQRVGHHRHRDGQPRHNDATR